MHERSLVKALLDQAVALARADAAHRVIEVRVRVGPLAGVEPPLLRRAFADLANGALFDGTQLVVSEVPLQAHCRACDAQFNIVDFHFLCAKCGSRDIDTTDGDAVILESVEFALKNNREPADGDCY